MIELRNKMLEKYLSFVADVITSSTGGVNKKYKVDTTRLENIHSRSMRKIQFSVDNSVCTLINTNSIEYSCSLGIFLIEISISSSRQCSFQIS